MPVNSFLNYPMAWKPDKNSLKRPIYLSIAKSLETDIVSGKLPPGTKLPPQRELADYLDINFTTVTRAYKYCEMKGLIYAVMGSGTFVSPNASTRATICTVRPKTDYIELGYIGSFCQVNDLTVKAVKKAVNKKYLNDLLSYDYPSGFPHHKEAAIQWLKPLGIDVQPKNISLAPATQNAVLLCLVSFFEPGDKIAVDRFTFSNFIELSKLLNLRLIPVDFDSEGMSAENLDYLCQKNKIKGAFIMPSCCNPTTITISAKRRSELRDVFKKYNLIVIEDDIDAFMTSGTSEYIEPIFPSLSDQVIYISGLSKPLSPGLRLSYIVYDECFSEAIEHAMFNINTKTSSIAAEAASQLIFSGLGKEIIEKKRKLAKTANELYYDIFPEVPRFGHGLSFYRWHPISSSFSPSQIEGQLLDMGIRVNHSQRFSCVKDLDHQFLRVSLSSTPDMETLETGLNILKNYLNGR